MVLAEFLPGLPKLPFPEFLPGLPMVHTEYQTGLLMPRQDYSFDVAVIFSYSNGGAILRAMTW